MDGIQSIWGEEKSINHLECFKRFSLLFGILNNVAIVTASGMLKKHTASASNPKVMEIFVTTTKRGKNVEVQRNGTNICTYVGLFVLH